MVILAAVLAAVAPYVPIYQAMPSRAAIKAPVRELAQIGWMAGTWRCHIYSFATGSVRSRDYGETTTSPSSSCRIVCPVS